MEMLLSIINKILKANGEPLLKKIEKEDNLRDIGLSSFDLAELTVRLEDVYNVDVFEDGVVETIGEITFKLGL